MRLSLAEYKCVQILSELNEWLERLRAHIDEFFYIRRTEKSNQVEWMKMRARSIDRSSQSSQPLVFFSQSQV